MYRKWNSGNNMWKKWKHGCYYWSAISRNMRNWLCNSTDDGNNTATCDCTNECDSTQPKIVALWMDYLFKNGNSVNTCYYFSQYFKLVMGNIVPNNLEIHLLISEACTDECLQSQNYEDKCSNDFRKVLSCHSGNYNQLENRTCYWESRKYCNVNEGVLTNSAASAYCSNILIV